VVQDDDVTLISSTNNYFLSLHCNNFVYDMCWHFPQTLLLMRSVLSNSELERLLSSEKQFQPLQATGTVMHIFQNLWLYVKQ
jgi:hypothetical protein